MSNPILHYSRAVLCQVPLFQDALFLTFTSYYVFHLGYPAAIENVYFFLQDYVLVYPDSCHRKGTYLATASDIKKCALHLPSAFNPLTTNDGYTHQARQCA